MRASRGQRGLWWLERRQSWRPAVLLLTLGTLLGLLYGLYVLRAPGSLGFGLGPWSNGGWDNWVGPVSMTPPGLVHGLYTFHTGYAPGWQDWLGPLVISVTGAWFGARVRQDQGFLELQPLPWGRVLALRLLVGTAVLALLAAIACTLVTLRGQTTMAWLSPAQHTRLWLDASLLLWLRGLLVMAASALLVQFLPLLVAAGVPLLGSVALLQPVSSTDITLGVGVSPAEWFRLVIAPSYTQAVMAPLLNRENVPLDELQAFMVSHVPAHLAITPGWNVVGTELAILAVLLALTPWLGSRRPG